MKKKVGPDKFRGEIKAQPKDQAGEAGEIREGV